MTPDGRCAPRVRRDEVPSLERAHADARDEETRRELCADARGEIIESLGMLARACRADHECLTIEVLECGATVADAEDPAPLEARWRSYAGVCGSDDSRCAGMHTTCESGRCERSLGVVRP